MCWQARHSIALHKNVLSCILTHDVCKPTPTCCVWVLCTVGPVNIYPKVIIVLKMSVYRLSQNNTDLHVESRHGNNKITFLNSVEATLISSLDD